MCDRCVEVVLLNQVGCVIVTGCGGMWKSLCALRCCQGCGGFQWSFKISCGMVILELQGSAVVDLLLPLLDSGLLNMLNAHIHRQR